MARQTGAGEPAKAIDCAWCGDWFDGVVELIRHVESVHLDDPVLDPVA